MRHKCLNRLAVAIFLGDDLVHQLVLVLIEIGLGALRILHLIEPFKLDELLIEAD